MKKTGLLPHDLTGTILVSAPILRDPNFHRTILFLSSHSAEDGALGFVLNRPIGSSLALPLSSGELAVEAYYGGPVQSEAVVLASLQWRQPPGLVAFHTFGEDLSDLDVAPEWRKGLRAFAGYAGWSPGQLEQEIEHHSWLVLPPTQELIQAPPPETAWMEIMRNASPLLALLAQAPDDPSLN